jgi:hypothetical protein
VSKAVDSMSTYLSLVSRNISYFSEQREDLKTNDGRLTLVFPFYTSLEPVGGFPEYIFVYLSMYELKSRD